MKSRPALPGRPAWVRSWRSLESDRSWQWHPEGQFHGKSDPEQNAVPILTVPRRLFWLGPIFI
jgi:hypothetical protein